MGAGHQKDQAMIRVTGDLEFSVSPLILPRRGVGLETELMTDYVYMRKPP